MRSSPTLACSRWCASSRASGARLFSPAWPAARNWSRQCEARAAVIPNARDTDSRSSPRSRRSTVARVRRAENRPLRSRSAAAPVALRALSAAVDSSTCFLISTRLLRELSRNQVSKKTLGRRTSPHTATPAATPERPTLQERAGPLAALGWSGRDAEWIALVAFHSGVFTRSQFADFFQTHSRVAALRFVRALIDKKLAIEDDRGIFPGGARAVLLTGKAIYRALGIADVRHRRGKEATTHVLMRRLLALDYLIERPTLG